MAIEAEPDEDIVSDRHGRNIESEKREREREKAKYYRQFYLRHFTDNTGKLRPLLKNLSGSYACKKCRPPSGMALSSPRSTQGMTSDGSFLFVRASHVVGLPLHKDHDLRKFHSMFSNPSSSMTIQTIPLQTA